MADWTEGYFADIDYTYGYFAELSPLRATLAMLYAGVAPPDIATACELGFGLGLSINIHAAASPVQWHGTDFSPSHAAFAGQLAQASGADVRLSDAAFAEFCARPDLPEFDYIALHGIWTWISDENRSILVDFVRRRLRVGGLLYVSYNTLPGWAAFVPMRDLLARHWQTLSAPAGNPASRIDAALEFGRRLLAANPAFARANPYVGERIRQIAGQDRSYLAHEYFNRHWRPMSFADMADWLEPAKVQYACSAHFIDHLGALNLTAEQRDMLESIPDEPLRETVRDFFVNQHFRRDYWVKGRRVMDPLARLEALRQQRVVLVTARGAVELKVKGALGEGKLNADVYGAVLDAVAEQRAVTLGEIEDALRGRGISFAQIVEAVFVLCGKGNMAPAQDAAATAARKPYCDRLNALLARAARADGKAEYLASPVIGGGIRIPRFEQIFLQARSEGGGPDEWGRSTSSTLSAIGQQLVKDGRPFASGEEAERELTRQATEFEHERLPILRALGVA